MNKEKLKNILSVPTYSTREERMREFLVDYAIDNSIDYHIDEKGNLYLVKGSIEEGENYPCVVSHIDTVHRNQGKLIDDNVRLEIIEVNDDHLIAMDPITGRQTGIGGDDKCGVAICLEIFESVDVIKAAFFVEEEIGMVGSRNADWDFLADCAYFIQFDAPGDNWVSEKCMNRRLGNVSFYNSLKDIFKLFGQTKISSDPFTDVLALRTDGEVNCINFFAGYHKMHTPQEYVIPSQVSKAVNIGIATISKLGLKRSFYEFVEEEITN